MITKEQYGEWRNHPATLFFRQFLKDRREALIQGGTELWLNQPSAFELDRAERRGRILQLFECEDIAWDLIEAFYQEKEANAAESAETV